MARGLVAVTGVFVFLVGALLVLSPESYLRVYATEYVPGMDFPARRFAPALLGMGIVLMMARTLPNGRFLTALCVITGLVFFVVAATGVHAWATEAAKSAILWAAAFEIALGVLLLAAARSVRRAE
ncbi:hypothetical protein [Marivita hallyeonensis]|uniref:DoxX-like family protein n=1 Tax=Marivita hallyeonensis TaxID=996342 RepID=A0A1M5RZA8_9RHOB|nr:hypothetical protein [Marivita hallyeonensis]SHH31511.1 hypothetical protein SAMN05443551_1946 [Marivita hallyeonensis]